MGDTNRSQLAYIPEVTWGVTPGSPAMSEIRFTGESLNKNIQNILSQEIRSDRQVTDLIQVGKETSGDINFELSYGNFDTFLKAALWSAGWSTPLAVSSTVISASTTDDSFNRASGSFVSDGIVPYQWIKIAGFSNAGNNGYFRVLTVAALKITVDANLTTESAGNTITIKGSYIRNGTTQNSFTIEKGFLDISQYIAFTGQVINNLQLNVASQQIVTGSMSFMGKDASISGTPLDASLTAANANEVVNAIGNIGSLRENGVEVATPNFIRSFSVNLVNNVRTKYAVGSDSPIGLGVGKIDLTGNLSTYFGNEDIYEKYLNGTRTSLDFRITDSAGNTILIDIPEMEFDSGTVVAQGQDQDVYAEMGYRAVRDGTYGYMIQISTFA